MPCIRLVPGPHIILVHIPEHSNVLDLAQRFVIIVVAHRPRLVLTEGYASCALRVHRLLSPIFAWLCRRLPDAGQIGLPACVNGKQAAAVVEPVRLIVVRGAVQIHAFDINDIITIRMPVYPIVIFVHACGNLAGQIVSGCYAKRCAAKQILGDPCRQSEPQVHIMAGSTARPGPSWIPAQTFHRRADQERHTSSTRSERR